MEPKGAVKLRQFSPGDMESVRRIEGAHTRYLTPLSSLSSYYTIPPEGFIVAEADGRVVGFVVANMIRDREGRKAVHVLSIAVDSASKKRGVGRALMKRIEDAFKDQGADRVMLEVRVSNRDAREFYKRLGYREVSVAKHYYRMRGYTEDAVIMAKSVSGRPG